MERAVERLIDALDRIDAENEDGEPDDTGIADAHALALIERGGTKDAPDDPDE